MPTHGGYQAIFSWCQYADLSLRPLFGTTAARTNDISCVVAVVGATTLQHLIWCDLMWFYVIQSFMVKAAGRSPPPLWWALEAIAHVPFTALMLQAYHENARIVTTTPVTVTISCHFFWSRPWEGATLRPTETVRVHGILPYFGLLTDFSVQVNCFDLVL